MSRLLPRLLTRLLSRLLTRLLPRLLTRLLTRLLSRLLSRLLPRLLLVVRFSLNFVAKLFGKFSQFCLGSAERLIFVADHTFGGAVDLVLERLYLVSGYLFRLGRLIQETAIE